MPSAGAAATAWEVVTRSRQATRPSAEWYLRSSFDGFRELHGDRRYRDDPAIRGGIAWVRDQPVVVVAQECGRSAGGGDRHNFGMPFPEGYHKALRLMRLADHYGRPIVTLVDTPGAYPGLGAEERGQAGAIAALLAGMASLEVATVAVIIGQGGSGGALALALADRVVMLENATYSVISPEGCASILWRSSDRAPEAARALGLTASMLRELGVVDEVVPEPAGGIGQHRQEAALRVRRVVRRHLRALLTLDPDERRSRREARYAALGVWEHERAPEVRRWRTRPGDER
jgi:acetyl-CoA carboxylase carboxyl transferase alpha subunit